MGHTILIVDDSPTSVPELKTLLEGEDYTVLTALRGEEALDTLSSCKVDLVIAEALLPGMDGFELVRQLRKQPGCGTIPVIMLTVRSATEDYTAGFEAGADEYFLKPLEAPKLIAATRGLLARHEMSQLERPWEQGHGTGAAPLVTRAHRGEIITVFSLKGGVGTSTIAVNVAVAIKQLVPSGRVGLIDLSLEEGTDALMLDIVPTSTIAEWAREDMQTATPYLLNQYFTQHRTGVSLLGAPPSPEQAETITPDVVRTTMELAPSAFDYVVVDTSSTFSESTLIALESAQAIILPLTPDMAALKTTVNTMRILRAVKIADEKLRLVLNEIIPRAGLTLDQLQTSLGQEPLVIPHAGAGFIESSNQGMPLVTASPPPVSAKAVMELARSVCEPEMVVDEAEKGRMGFVRSALEGRFRRA